MKKDVILRTTAAYAATVVAILLGASVPSASQAQVGTGGTTCVVEYGWFDYYTNGQLTDSQYEPIGVNCHSVNGQLPAGIGEGGGSGVGGGNDGNDSANVPDLTDLAISAKLKCALDEYLHSDVRLGASRTMKKVNAWAFGKQSPTGWFYKFNSNNMHPGVGWRQVGGIAAPGTAYGRLYNQAFVASPIFNRTGSRPGVASNSLAGVSGFEMSLFVGGHEAAHLHGKMDESHADWYGIDAVRKYRADGGAKCAGQPG